MPAKLIRHGTNTGYRTELAAGGPENVCKRCHNAHNVFQTQYNRANKAKGIKYAGDQVIDHLYVSGTGTVPRRPLTVVRTADSSPDDDYTVTAVPRRPEPSEADPGPSLSDRMRALLSKNEPETEYVSEDYPNYITPDSVDPDPDPDGYGYDRIPEDSAEYIINAAGMAKIEDSLGTYLSIFGLTLEMVDPYCGPILAENMDNIVKRWAKVISKYPKAAELFMDGKGGTLMAWISALQATWPILYALYEHHFAKSVQTSGGNIYRRNKQGMPDPTMPPMQDTFNYTAG